MTLDASGVQWESALDVDAPQAVGVAYRLVTGLKKSDLGPVASLAPGFHTLASQPTSGALDYLRSPALQDGIVVKSLHKLFRRGAPPDWNPPPPDLGLPSGPPPSPAGYPPPPFGTDPVDTALKQTLSVAKLIPLNRLNLPIHWRSFPWIDSNGDNALDALKPHLEGAARIYVYGQRYTDGNNGVHDTHMNQGDPAGSQWYASNGTWQDGAVACQAPDDTVTIWQVRFKTQSLHTDDNGHPV